MKIMSFKRQFSKFISRKIFKTIPNNRKIFELKNTENGACYIFGDGASIKFFDLSSFSNYPSISLGYLPLHEHAGLLNLKYSMLCDGYVWRKFYNFYCWSNRLLGFLREGKLKIALKILNPRTLFYLFLKRNIKKFCLINNQLIKKLIYVINCTNYSLKDLKKINAYYYHDSLELGQNDLDIYKSSLRFSIFFSYYLGFKTVYLVGCDYLDIEPRLGHWYENGPGDLFNGPNDLNFINDLRKFIDIRLITRNRTSGSNYISYTKFFNKELHYKENYYLLKKEKLDELEHEGFYRIYEK